MASISFFRPSFTIVGVARARPSTYNIHYDDYRRIKNNEEAGYVLYAAALFHLLRDVGAGAPGSLREFVEISLSDDVLERVVLEAAICLKRLAGAYLEEAPVKGFEQASNRSGTLNNTLHQQL